MFFAFNPGDIITVIFGWLMGFLYNLTNNYGVAMILFALCVQMVLMPITAKSKKSMMKMSRLQPQIQDIQKRYSGDQQKQGEALQQLYRDEGVSMYGGCLWSLIPMFILFPIFGAIREPITYILGVGSETAAQIVEIIKTAAPEAFTGNSYYAQVTAAQLIPQYAAELQTAMPGLSQNVLDGINFQFAGIDLGLIPSWTFWNWSAYNWATVGLFLIPVLSAVTQYLQSKIMMKMNNSVITNEKGVQDDDIANNSQAAQTNQSMMIMMPIMSLWIGFTVPAGLSVYWFVGGVIRTIQDIILTKHYRKIYDAEDAVRLQRAMELDAIEAERERIRAERRAANPDGQTQNTSKKKLQKAEAARLAAEKAAAAREYNAKRGIVEAEDEKNVLSGIPERPYCKGRAYDPDRYSR